MLLLGEQGWSNYLKFRNYMRSHPVARSAYQQLKQELATQYTADRAAYSAAKAGFVQSILAAAQADSATE